MFGATAAGPTRRLATASILERAHRTAARCGVSRLADITRLDRIGLPVWQAVRPAGRALSIHQGKGISALAAKIGALCEAIESHYAEQAPADGPYGTLAELPPGTEAPALADLALDRAHPPPADMAMQWCQAHNIVSGAPACLPHAFVSLDFTRDWHSRFDRSSGGLGAGTTKARASEKAILELIENDAVGRWEREDPLSRMATLLDPDTVTLRWFQDWRAHLDSLGMQLHLCAPGSVTGHPVFHCTLLCHDRAEGIAIFAGSACHGSAETALFGALAEAIQSRLTFIAGARDDMLPSLYASRAKAPPAIGPVPPPAPGFPLVAWQSIGERRSALPDLVADLGRAGLDRIWCKTLSPPEAEIRVVKAFIGGLGSLRRTEQPSARACA
ncbi:YcaO-like family protein [Sphingomonas sp. LaA6.9]|uniref:YcaO-like family protein n=1 Tax=Sphingomonas sp. LaA6.9 TaxID=2919914 RepID=UPI001F4F4961|nr:YcaO-like family protein [Sphingomonas sp. LaA6.9]MCJ8158453.1 YcaO-like family protein [Sphingomonas sp. LaA6.9]